MSAAARTLLALALQVLALAALAIALLGGAWLDGRSRPRALVLVDRSQSVPYAAAELALAEVARAADAAGFGELRLLEFAARPAANSSSSASSVSAAAGLDMSATNIEAALDAALADHARSPLDALVVISDGHENRGDAARALRTLVEAGLPPQWFVVGRPPPDTRIVDVLAPARSLIGQDLPIRVQLAGLLNRPLRVTATARTGSGETQAASGAVDAAGSATLRLDGRHGGAVVVDLALEDATTGGVIETLADAAVVDVAPRAAMLYVQGSGGPLAGSLQRGGWSLDLVPAARLEAQTDRLDGYQAVVLDDVAIADAGPRFWQALVSAVQARGVGLMVLGGERSFARGGYRGSLLETVLPLLSEPAALDQPAAVMFAVDKSGSMGQGSGGVDRFQLAQRAVQETARGLGERDSLGLLVFDVAPRVLLPLGPARAGSVALDRAWQASPNGGTRLAPALDAAIVELERAPAARRMLVVVTDGFVDDASSGELRARLDRSGIETIALAVGPDADVAALERLIGPPSGQVLRVGQAADLPQVMRSALERRRARVERGTIAVLQTQALPFGRGQWSDWPAVAAHAVTRAQPDATVALQSQRGEPLIAWRSAGRGRVLAVTSGLGAWTPRWLEWREWPQLAGGLADWVAGSGRGPALGLTLTDLPGALQLEADLAGEAAGQGGEDVSITVDTPTTRGLPVATEAVAAGRLRATLPEAGAGLYTFYASSAQGTQRHLHLRRPRAEQTAWGSSPALPAWRAAGLIHDWRPDAMRVDAGARRSPRPIDRSLLALAFVLFAAAVLCDRGGPELAGAGAQFAGVASAIRRWRTGRR